MPVPPPAMPTESLHQEDVRAIVKLFSHIAIMQGDANDKKRALMQGLCDLINADYWLWNIMSFVPNEIPVAYAVLYSMPESMFTAFAATNYEFPDDQVTQQIIANCATKKHWTRNRKQLVPNTDFMKLGSYTKFLSKTDVGDSMLSLYPIHTEQSIYSNCCIHRSKSKPPFNERDCLIYHILISEVDWLHQLDLPETDREETNSLPPRLQTIFALLLEGHAPKRIAHHLEITESTVRTYIKQIYKHFSVSGRLELTKRFTHGDGNHLPS
ncbi:LuxR C-terminal-related transcriptional regulator [Poriferisphaera sp. WC338]|uniref:LuxR C-terminal-related transcriptional regulator n=1 Tax=Poriferisphaera sp. WC338 TaxID=3425129 RepID=UPI003D813325